MAKKTIGVTIEEKLCDSTGLFAILGGASFALTYSLMSVSLVMSILLCLGGAYVLIGSFLRHRDGKPVTCHYCGKLALQFERLITVRWLEQTKYSNKEIEFSASFHKHCHENAVEKFKIPDPKFADPMI